MSIQPVQLSMLPDQIRPLLTVLMPIHRVHKKYFREAIGSLITQDVTFEHRIIYADDIDITSLPHFDWNDMTYLTKQSGIGLGDALNCGMHEAQTEYITMLPADDLLPPNSLKILYEYIKKYPTVDFFHSSRQVIDDNGSIISATLRAREVTSWEDFYHGMVKHLLCWRRSKAIEISGIDPTLHGGDDYDFPWRMYEAGAKFKAIPECLFLYRDHRSHHRLTTHVSTEIQIESLRKIFKKHNIPDDIIEAEIERRKNGYLRQAEDGWSESYPTP